jgi:hypothetical protein
MTIRSVWSVQCDSCGFKDLFSHDRAEYAQQFVESAGWITDGQRHACPTCVRSLPKPVTTPQ